MNLVWKLLRQHISIPQFVGFAFANLFGMLIVLLGYQFYKDVSPVFTSEDSFMKSNYIIVEKKIGTGKRHCRVVPTLSLKMISMTSTTLISPLRRAHSRPISTRSRLAWASAEQTSSTPRSSWRASPMPSSMHRKERGATSQATTWYLSFCRGLHRYVQLRVCTEPLAAEDQ